jgi:hypothetical protein
MHAALTRLIFFAGIGQLGVLIASALVPFRLNWREELRGLSRLHRQMYWVYGGYVVLSIIAFASLSIFNAGELANGSGLARGFCAYVAVFWGIRIALQGIFDVKEYLTAWWLGGVLSADADVYCIHKHLLLGGAAIGCKVWLSRGDFSPSSRKAALVFFLANSSPGWGNRSGCKTDRAHRRIASKPPPKKTARPTLNGTGPMGRT